MKQTCIFLFLFFSSLFSYSQVDSAGEIRSVNLKINFESPTNGGTYFNDSIPLALSVTNLGPDDLEVGDTIAWRIDQILPQNTYAPFRLNARLPKDNTVEVFNSAVRANGTGSLQLCAHIVPDRRIFGNLRFTWLDSDTTNNRQCNTFTVEARAPSSIQSINESVVKITPNPANSILNIDISQLQKGQYNLSLIDLLGRIVYQQNFNNELLISLPIQDYTRGIYNVIIAGQDMNLIKKVVFN